MADVEMSSASAPAARTSEFSEISVNEDGSERDRWNEVDGRESCRWSGWQRFVPEEIGVMGGDNQGGMLIHRFRFHYR